MVYKIDQDYDAELTPQHGRFRRALMTIVLLIGFAIAESTLWLFALTQFCIFVVRGEPNIFICKISNSVSEWVASTVKFVMFASNTAPFPFNPWPKNDI